MLCLFMCWPPWSPLCWQSSLSRVTALLSPGNKGLNEGTSARGTVCSCPHIHKVCVKNRSSWAVFHYVIADEILTNNSRLNAKFVVSFSEWGWQHLGTTVPKSQANGHLAWMKRLCICSSNTQIVFWVPLGPESGLLDSNPWSLRAGRGGLVFPTLPHLPPGRDHSMWWDTTGGQTRQCRMCSPS